MHYKTRQHNTNRARIALEGHKRQERNKLSRSKETSAGPLGWDFSARLNLTVTNWPNCRRHLGRLHGHSKRRRQRERAARDGKGRRGTLFCDSLSITSRWICHVGLGRATDLDMEAYHELHTASLSRAPIIMIRCSFQTNTTTPQTRRQHFGASFKLTKHGPDQQVSGGSSTLEKETETKLAGNRAARCCK